MKYCRNCGAPIPDEGRFCPKCGTNVEAQVNNQPGYIFQNTPAKPVTRDSGSPIWGILSFFLPILGLILYLVWMDDRPGDAKGAGKGALIGVIVWVALAVLMVCVFVVLYSGMY